MANELEYPQGMPVTLIFQLANPSANATTAMTLAQGGAGPKVPTGYKFHPLMISGESNADLTAGTAIFKVTAAGTVLANGPTATLSDTVQSATGVQRVGADPIAAGSAIGVKVVADASYAPTTADLDCVVVGVFLPA